MSDYELSDRLSRFEYAINDNALQRFSPVAVDARVPPVSNLQLFSATAVTNHGTKLVIKWVSPTDEAIDCFQVWVSGHLQVATAFQHVISVQDSPAFFWIVPNTTNVPIVIVVRTKLKNGLKTALDASPSVSAYVTL